MAALLLQRGANFQAENDVRDEFFKYTPGIFALSHFSNKLVSHRLVSVNLRR